MQRTAGMHAARLLAAASVAVLATGPGGCRPRKPPRSAPPGRALATVDEADLVTLLHNDAGGPLVVSFGAAWCAPCVDELGALGELARHHVATRFVLVDLGERDDDRERMAAHHAELAGAPVELVHLDVPDAAGVLQRTVAHWPAAIPVTLLVAPGGSPARQFAGRVDPVALGQAIDLAEAGDLAP